MFSPTSDTRNVGYCAPNERQSRCAHDMGGPAATQEPQCAAGLVSNQRRSGKAAKDRTGGGGFQCLLHVTRASLNRGAGGVLGDKP
jgi:hypothetical protein